MIVKIWKQLDWTGRRGAQEPLAASDILDVLELYSMKFPEVWEWILMLETCVFQFRQGKIETRRKQEELKKRAKRG